MVKVNLKKMLNVLPVDLIASQRVRVSQMEIEDIIQMQRPGTV